MTSVSIGTAWKARADPERWAPLSDTEGLGWGPENLHLLQRGEVHTLKITGEAGGLVNNPLYCLSPTYHVSIAVSVKQGKSMSCSHTHFRRYIVFTLGIELYDTERKLMY